MMNGRFSALWAGVVLLAAGNIQQLPGQSSKLVLPGENLPSVEFNQTGFGPALEYFRARGNEALAKKGHAINLVLIDPDGEIAKKQITLSLNDVPWATALKYACDLAGVHMEADFGTLVIGRKADVSRLRLSRTKNRHSEGSAPLVHRIGAIPMRDLEFHGAHLSEIVTFLRAKTQPTANNPRATPINFIIKENAAKEVANRPVSLTLAKAPLAEVLHFATGLAGCRYRVDANAIVIGDEADLQHIPRPRIRDRGAIYQSLLKTPVASVDIAKGTPLSDLIGLIQQYSRNPQTLPNGINLIDSTGEKLTTWSPLKLQNVRLLDLVRYVNELTGTTIQVEAHALTFQKDPHVKSRPGDSLPSLETTTRSSSGGLKFDP